jgi:hypothetical protein
MSGNGRVDRQYDLSKGELWPQTLPPLVNTFGTSTTTQGFVQHDWDQSKWQLNAKPVEIGEGFHAYFGMLPAYDYQSMFPSLTAFVTAVRPTTTTAGPVDKAAPLAAAERELFMYASRLPLALRDGVTERFKSLLSVLRDETEVFDLNLGSLRIALSFLAEAIPTRAPDFTLTNTGDFYLQWFDADNGLVGVTFKPDGRSIWSASQKDAANPSVRTAEAGERTAKNLVSFLPAIAPWAFAKALDYASWRRVAA